MRRLTVALILTLISPVSDTLAISVTGIDKIAVAKPDTRRVVIVGKEIVETVFALGKSKNIVGRDLTATFPPSATKIPSVGYINNLGAEAIIALKPTLVIVNDTTPPVTVKQLRDAKVPVLQLATPQSADDALNTVDTLGLAFNAQAQARRIHADMVNDLKVAQDFIASRPRKPKALILVGRPETGVAALGNGGGATSYAAFVKLLGAENVANFKGLKNLGGEGVVELAPDTLMFIARSTGSLSQLGGRQKLLARPEIALTPAAKQGRLYEIPEHDITFGPSIGKSLLKVAKLVYP